MKKHTLTKYTHSILMLWYRYTALQSKIKQNNIDFINLGLIDDNFQLPFQLSVEDSAIYSERNIKLYTKLVHPITSKINSALEIGCGFGGGCYLLYQYFKINDVIGIDILNSSIKHAQKRFHHIPNIKFKNYNSDNFTQLNKQFDLIICLEASLHFQNKPIFFQNVAASLNSNGLFCYADIFSIHYEKEIEAIIAAANLKIIEKEDISCGVLASINTLSTQKGIHKIIETLLLDIHNANFIKNSKLYNKLKNNELKYIRYKIKKIS